MMNYIELIEVAQHFEKQVGTDTLFHITDLERQIEKHKQKIEAATLAPGLHKALTQAIDDLQTYTQNVNCDKITLIDSLLPCLIALHEVHQHPLLHQTIDLFNEVRVVVDKFRITKGLRLVIEGCMRPVRRETQRFFKEPPVA